MATIRERLEILDSMHCLERQTMEAKAKDYSSQDDCNSNVAACERLGICRTETGVLTRMLDKFQRLINLDSREAAVTTESIYETIHDLRNYLAIYYHVKKEKDESKRAAGTEMELAGRAARAT